MGMQNMKHMPTSPVICGQIKERSVAGLQSLQQKESLKYYNNRHNFWFEFIYLLIGCFSNMKNMTFFLTI